MKPSLISYDPEDIKAHLVSDLFVVLGKLNLISKWEVVKADRALQGVIDKIIAEHLAKNVK